MLRGKDNLKSTLVNGLGNGFNPNFFLREKNTRQVSAHEEARQMEPKLSVAATDVRRCGQNVSTSNRRSTRTYRVKT